MPEENVAEATDVDIASASKGANISPSFSYKDLAIDWPILPGNAVF